MENLAKSNENDLREKVFDLESANRMSKVDEVLLRAEFESNPKLRDEFGSFKAFAAYRKHMTTIAQRQSDKDFSAERRARAQARKPGRTGEDQAGESAGVNNSSKETKSGSEEKAALQRFIDENGTPCEP